MPAKYRMSIGANPGLGNQDRSISVSKFRIHEMTPLSLDNVERFAASFAKAGVYFLTPMVMNTFTGIPEVLSNLAILKKHLHSKEAWEVGKNDLENVCIQGDEDVIIPDDRINDAPILELLKERGRNI